MPRAGKENGVADCQRCGDECGCAGGVKAGGCGTGCQAGSCKCAHRREEPPEVRMSHTVPTLFRCTLAGTTLDLPAVAPAEVAQDSGAAGIGFKRDRHSHILVQPTACRFD